MGDGYCNSGVVYSAQGEWQVEFALPSTAAELLRKPHSIVVQGTHLSAACCRRQCHQGLLLLHRWLRRTMGEYLWETGTATREWWSFQLEASGRGSLCCPAQQESRCATRTALCCRSVRTLCMLLSGRRRGYTASALRPGSLKVSFQRHGNKSNPRCKVIVFLGPKPVFQSPYCSLSTKEMTVARM